MYRARAYLLNQPAVGLLGGTSGYSEGFVRVKSPLGTEVPYMRSHPFAIRNDRKDRKDRNDQRLTRVCFPNQYFAENTPWDSVFSFSFFMIQQCCTEPYSYCTQVFLPPGSTIALTALRSKDDGRWTMGYLLTVRMYFAICRWIIFAGRYRMGVVAYSARLAPVTPDTVSAWTLRRLRIFSMFFPS
jgi:hypothetical protein